MGPNQTAHILIIDTYIAILLADEVLCWVSILSMCHISVEITNTSQRRGMISNVSSAPP
ncbi:uncharacterized protein BDW47DRAFT_99805 [Aspergillus candidus]|uniref:Uncharacterized protein n=1 Tax=Aspergillus candidus TaxID=41067 RepID=A0A2I2FKU3_ASPCN|nr:hypothetical protein BDW47DRAFT_99805 [Aspergillus candidus]PLB41257.1 hypothetical protein BDW47DRAFT_99805 [Aspergillus candidus]